MDKDDGNRPGSSTTPETSTIDRYRLDVSTLEQPAKKFRPNSPTMQSSGDVSRRSRLSSESARGDRLCATSNRLCYSSNRLCESSNRLCANSNSSRDGYCKSPGLSLHSATMAGDLVAVRSVLSRWHMDSCDAQGRTPLHIASEKGFIDIVRLLLDVGADVDKRIASTYQHLLSQNGCTALHAAAREGWLDIVKLLLASGADVHVASEEGFTPLHLSCGAGHRDIAEQLLNSGADVDAGFKSRYEFDDDDEGVTPLHLAAFAASEETVRLLLDRHARLDAVTKHGDTPLHIACTNRTLSKAVTAKVAELLVVRGAYTRLPEGSGFSGFTRLHYAAWYGLEEAVKCLVANRDVDVNAATADNGLTPLHLACEGCLPSIAECLLENGAHINVTTTGKNYYLKGTTPLHLVAFWSAAIRGDRQQFSLALFDLLLEWGADVNAVDGYGRTPLVFYLKRYRERSAGAVRIFAKHLAGRRARNSFLSEKNLEAIHNHDLLREAIEVCDKEILRMKGRCIGDSTVTCFDLFTKDCRRSVDYAANEEVVTVAESEDLAAEFPIYASDLSKKFHRAKDRRDLQCKSDAVLSRSNLSCLTYDCMRNLKSYLSNKDLSNVIKSKHCDKGKRPQLKSSSDRRPCDEGDS